MNKNYVSAVGWLSLVCSHAVHVSVRVRSLGWVCGVQERLYEGAACRSDCVRARCDRDSRAQVYLLLILKTLGKLGKNGWRSLAMQGLDPNRISTYVLGVLVLKKKGGVFLRGINRYKSSFDVSINAHFFSKAQRSNHLTPHRLINAAPCKPTFSLPHACMGY